MKTGIYMTHKIAAHCVRFSSIRACIVGGTAPREMSTLALFASKSCKALCSDSSAVTDLRQAVSTDCIKGLALASGRVYLQHCSCSHLILV